MHKWTREEEQFLRDNVKGIPLSELTDRFNKHFALDLSRNSIRARKKRLGLKSGINTCFVKGQQSFNKGLKWDDYMPKESQDRSRQTTFKKGNVSINHRPVGSERVNVDGYVEIKVAEPNKWDLKQRVVYELHNGPIPEGYNIIFLDGNRLNTDISNLMMVSKAEALVMNNKGYFTEDREITETGAMIAKVLVKARKAEKNER